MTGYNSSSTILPIWLLPVRLEPVSCRASTHQSALSIFRIGSKYFTPDSSWTWYASEGAPNDEGDFLFFGLVNGFELEFGYFSLSELQETRGPLGLLIERDLHFTPTTLRDLQEKHLKERQISDD
jgi:hypothetical protein